MDLGEKREIKHAMELRKWLRRVESVQNSVKILFTSRESLNWWKGGTMELATFMLTMIVNTAKLSDENACIGEYFSKYIAYYYVSGEVLHTNIILKFFNARNPSSKLYNLGN